MLVTSLHVKLRSLLECGAVVVKPNVDNGSVFCGEGGYYYGQDRVDILSKCSGQLPDGSGIKLTVPHDIAWVPRTKTVIAYAPSDTGAFEQMPDELRRMVTVFNKKKRALAN